MSCTAFRDGSSHLGLCPVSGLKVENDEIGKVGSVLVLAAEDKKFVALIQGRGMAWTASQQGVGWWW